MKAFLKNLGERHIYVSHINLKDLLYEPYILKFFMKLNNI